MRRLLAFAAAFLALLASTSGATAVRPVDRPAPEPAAEGVRADDRWVIAAAGDIACESDPNGPSRPDLCQYDDTSDLVVRASLDEVLLLGDNQYETGAYRDYLTYFDPTWGRAFDNISPVPGNHEYPDGPSARPGGYFRYFGEHARGPRGLGFYSYDLGACPDDPCWHVIALSSILCLAPGGCGPADDPDAPGPGNRMYTWLRRDLARHPDSDYPCTLAFWHHPLFSVSAGSGPTDAVGPLWDLLYEAGADIVLNGHSHNYQRWEPQTPQGALDPDRGIREFVVGTGGRSHYGILGGPPPDALAMAQSTSFGILRITLRPRGYRWAWVTAAGQPAFADASDGSVRCVRA
jgi:hypothetical protein